MTSLAVFQEKLHNIPFEIRAYIQTVDHLISIYHGDQIRDDGSPYSNHVRDVMRQILEIEHQCKPEIDWAMVIAGGCHDLIEDSYNRETPVTPEIIAQAFGQQNGDFGSKVAWLVSAVSKLPRSECPSKEYRLQEYYGRLFRSAKEDYRVLLIKYPDRKHNLATLHGLEETDPAKIKRVAMETLEVYVPYGETRALEVLPQCYHACFSVMVERMKRLALAYLTDEFIVQYEPKFVLSPV